MAPVRAPEAAPRVAPFAVALGGFGRLVGCVTPSAPPSIAPVSADGAIVGGATVCAVQGSEQANTSAAESIARTYIPNAFICSERTPCEGAWRLREISAAKPLSLDFYFPVSIPVVDFTGGPPGSCDIDLVRPDTSPL